jgi:hypothetical protein
MVAPSYGESRERVQFRIIRGADNVAASSHERMCSYSASGTRELQKYPRRTVAVG